MYTLPTIREPRGALTMLEAAAWLPFPAVRLFWVSDVPQGEVRGRHAHREQEQFLICLSGSCRVSADDGQTREEFLLDTAAKGLYLPARTWGEQWDHAPGTVLLVLVSGAYDRGDYVSDYEEFRRWVGGGA